MTYYYLMFFLLSVLICSCQKTENATKDYPRMIGDISYDEKIDSPDFSLCNDKNGAIQYYAFTSIIGEKPHLKEKYQLDKVFKENFNSKTVKKETGLIRIRFMVNCEGEIGRFRILGMDENYAEKEFDKSITDQLLFITQNYTEWKPLKTSTEQRDYYMYLIFKINHGEIIEILP